MPPQISPSFESFRPDALEALEGGVAAVDVVDAEALGGVAGEVFVGLAFVLGGASVGFGSTVGVDALADMLVDVAAPSDGESCVPPQAASATTGRRRRNRLAMRGLSLLRARKDSRP
jgi:hypothetical protein